MVSKHLKTGIIVSGLMVIFILVFYGYYCQDLDCPFGKKHRATISYGDPIASYLAGNIADIKFHNTVLNRHYDVNLDKVDVIVFLHMQKTGGTLLGKHLVKDVWTKPCKKERGRKRYDCRNRDQYIWLFSRYSTGWACGLHADWATLNSCVASKMDILEKKHRERRFHYITILRDPVKRYLSEWLHVQRGATWRKSKMVCGNKEYKVPKCYKGPDWTGVTLEDFIKCKNNPGNNRQTTMLANLSRAGCDRNTSNLTDAARDRIILESAKENLQNFSFFGILEYQTQSQYLFEETFNLEFRHDFIQLNVTHTSFLNITKEQHRKVLKANSMDIELYMFAKSLFFQRYNVTKLREGSSTVKRINHHRALDNRLSLERLVENRIKANNRALSNKILHKQFVKKN